MRPIIFILGLAGHLVLRVQSLLVHAHTVEPVGTTELAARSPSAATPHVEPAGGTELSSRSPSAATPHVEPAGTTDLAARSPSVATPHVALQPQEVALAGANGTITRRHPRRTSSAELRSMPAVSFQLDGVAEAVDQIKEIPGIIRGLLQQGHLPDPNQPANYTDLHVVLYGATGCLGGLAAQYLYRQEGVRWAIAGRSRERLRAVADGLFVDPEMPSSKPEIIVGSLEGDEDPRLWVRRARVVLNTAGPYLTCKAERLVQACVELGVHYADISTDFSWQRQLVNRFDKAAQRSGTKVVLASGFTSIVSDVGSQLAINALDDQPLECATDAKEDWRNQGLVLVKNKGLMLERRAYVACATDATKQLKVSCRPEECDSQPWCFVPRKCGSSGKSGTTKRCLKVAVAPDFCPKASATAYQKSDQSEVASLDVVLTAYNGGWSAGFLNQLDQSYAENTSFPKEWATDPYVLTPGAAADLRVDANQSVTGITNKTVLKDLGEAVADIMANNSARLLRRSFVKLNQKVRLRDGATPWTYTKWSGFVLKRPQQWQKMKTCPGAGVQQAGSWAMKFHAQRGTADAHVSIEGKGDPGYVFTPQSLAEVGLCLAGKTRECTRSSQRGGGVHTPASALEISELKDRLEILGLLHSKVQAKLGYLSSDLLDSSRKASGESGGRPRRRGARGKRKEQL